MNPDMDSEQIVFLMELDVFHQIVKSDGKGLKPTIVPNVACSTEFTDEIQL